MDSTQRIDYPCGLGMSSAHLQSMVLNIWDSNSSLLHCGECKFAQVRFQAEIDRNTGPELSHIT